ncbi:MAG: O-antigen ligase family protein [Geobacteraceae bacterium]
MRILLLKIIFPLLAFTSFINPFYGIINYTFISVIRPEQLTYGIPSIANVFAIAIALLFTASLIKGERLLDSLKTSYFKYYLGFIIAIYISTLISPYTDYSETNGSIYHLNFIPQTMVFCLCLYAVLLRLKEKEIQKYLILKVFFFLFMAVWGIQQYTRGNTLVEGLFGTAIIDRCAITGVFVLYLPLSIYFIKKQERLQKYFGVFCFVAFLCIIVMTQSRAGFLGMCLSMLAVFYFSRRKAMMAAFAVVIILIALPFVPDSYFGRIGNIKSQDIQGDEITDYSSASRLLLWKVGLKVFASNPLLGIGNLNFSKASREHASEYAGIVDNRLYETTFGSGGKRGLSHTHNTYLNILVEGGLLAAIPYYILLFLPLWKGYKLNKKYRDLSEGDIDLINLLNCGILGFLVAAFFANLIFIDYVYWNLTLSYFLSQRLEAKQFPSGNSG